MYKFFIVTTNNTISSTFESKKSLNLKGGLNFMHTIVCYGVKKPVTPYENVECIQLLSTQRKHCSATQSSDCCNSKPDTISKNDIAVIFKNVKPILNHAFKTPHTTHCYDTLLGNYKLPDPKYLSKKAKSIYTKELNEAMREENGSADFFWVYSGSTTESTWETQWKRDLIQRRNKIKSHTAQLFN